MGSSLSEGKLSAVGLVAEDGFGGGLGRSRARPGPGSGPGNGDGGL